MKRLLSPDSCPETPAVLSETRKKAERPKNIYLIMKAVGGMYWSRLGFGAIEAGRDLGAEVLINGIPGELRIEDQIRLLRNAVSARVDAIMIGVADSKTEVFEVERAYDAGIPVILVDTMVETEKYSAAILTDNREAGRLAAKELIRLLKGKETPEDKAGTVAMQIGTAASQTHNQRIIGFESYWAANAPQNWKLLLDDMKVNGGDVRKAVAISQYFLTAYPDLIAVFAPNNNSTVGFVEALEEKDRTDITMVGFDLSWGMERMIRSEKFNVSTILQKPYMMGYDGVRAALDIIAGKNPPEKIINVEVMIVNAANVDSEEIQKAANGK